MENLSKEFENLELSTQILIQAAVQRNIKVEILDEKDNFIRLIKENKKEYIKQATRTSADHYIAPLIMENKVLTKNLLNEQGIRVPSGRIYNKIDQALNDYPELKNNALVIKPNDANYGLGVSILQPGFSEKEYRFALKTASNFSEQIITEEFIIGKEYRFLVIGKQVIAVLHRIPANVIGNGTDTISELIRQKNKDPRRGLGYKKPLEKIRMTKIEKDYLLSQAMTPDTIPERDEIVFLRKNSNISTGGDSIDFTDQISLEYKEIAAKAASVVGAKICGVDMIINDLKIPPSGNNYGIIELNYNPAIHIHTYPWKGSNRRPADEILNLLGF